MRTVPYRRFARTPGMVESLPANRHRGGPGSEPLGAFLGGFDMGARRHTGMPVATFSNEAAQRLLEFSHDVACVVGFDGCIRQHTANWQQGLAEPSRDVAGSRFITLVDPGDRHETPRRPSV